MLRYVYKKFHEYQKELAAEIALETGLDTAEKLLNHLNGVYVFWMHFSKLWLIEYCCISSVTKIGEACAIDKASRQPVAVLDWLHAADFFGDQVKRAQMQTPHAPDTPPYVMAPKGSQQNCN